VDKTKRNNVWEQRYQQGTTGWDRGDVSPNLHYWLNDQSLATCRILVPGCGNGYEVLHLAKQGFDVVGIDIAPTAINSLKEVLLSNQLQAEVIAADFFQWQPEQTFDAIYEQTSLCALPLQEWQAYEQCLYQWLKPEGKLLAQFMQTEDAGGPPFHCDIEAMLKLFSQQRWKWSEEKITQVIHSDRKQEKVYLLEKQ
jgi:cyclopropane fatty-acyl-phospholipid synthase-like methyltransferase